MTVGGAYPRTVFSSPFRLSIIVRADPNKSAPFATNVDIWKHELRREHEHPATPNFKVRFYRICCVGTSVKLGVYLLVTSACYISKKNIRSTKNIINISLTRYLLIRLCF